MPLLKTGGETANQCHFDDFVGVGHVSCDGADEVADGGDDVRREDLNYVMEPSSRSCFQREG